MFMWVSEWCVWRANRFTIDAKLTFFLRAIGLRNFSFDCFRHFACCSLRRPLMEFFFRLNFDKLSQVASSTTWPPRHTHLIFTEKLQIFLHFQFKKMTRHLEDSDIKRYWYQYTRINYTYGAISVGISQNWASLLFFSSWRPKQLNYFLTYDNLSV